MTSKPDKNIGERIAAARGRTAVGARDLSLAAVRAAIYDNYGNLSKSARELGCSYASLNKFMKENPDLYELKNEAYDRVSDRAESTVIQSIELGDTTSAKWWLERQAVDRGFGTKKELTGKDGKDLIYGATEEERKKREALLRQEFLDKTMPVEASKDGKVVEAVIIEEGSEDED